MKYLRSILFCIIFLPLVGNAQLPPTTRSQLDERPEKPDARMEDLPQLTLKDTTIPPGRPMERLLVSPTAFGLKKNERDFRNLGFFYNSFQRGVTDKTTVGMGFIPLVVANFLWVDAKRTICIAPNVHVGIGGVAGGAVLLGFGDGPDLGGLLGEFGVLTIGSKRNFINLATSRLTAVAYGDWETLPWMVTLGSSFEITKKLRVFCEAANITPTIIEWMLAVGLSAIGKNKCFDAALILFPGSKTSVAPGLGVSVRY